jgi:hypothetical protein
VCHEHVRRGVHGRRRSCSEQKLISPSVRPEGAERACGRGHHRDVPPADRRRTAPVIRAHHRLKGGAAQLGATSPGLRGPFGVWPTDDLQDDEDQEHDLPVNRTNRSASASVLAASDNPAKGIGRWKRPLWSST